MFQIIQQSQYSSNFCHYKYSIFMIELGNYDKDENGGSSDYEVIEVNKIETIS